MNSRFRQARHGQQGQVSVIVLLLMLAFIGLTLFVINIGFVLRASRELRASADAAASAAAMDLSNNLDAPTAKATAIAYSMTPGSKNADSHLSNVSMIAGFPKVVCLTTIPGLVMVPSCSNVALGNAIVVEEQASVPTIGGSFLGVSTINITAKSLALMKGQGTPIPGNLVVIIDTTPSMASSDPSSTCRSRSGISHPTKLDCAKWGVRTLLTQLAPCSPSLTDCGAVDATGNVANPVSEVALMTFPGLTSPATNGISNYAVDEYNCQAVSLSPYIAPYATPSTFPPYFTIVSFSSDYRSSYTSPSLNSGTSKLVNAVDWHSQSGCSTGKYGLQIIPTIPPGRRTYYAGALAEAQADLSNPSIIPPPRNSLQSAIILLSDGDATAQCTNVKNGLCGSGSDFTTATPSTYGQNECQAAITAAKTAAGIKNAAGLKTWVYSIAFGATKSGSCASDHGALSGCSTMQQIASDPTKFFSDAVSGCVSPANPSITSLDQIFSAIGYDFSSTRVLPFNLYTP